MQSRNFRYKDPVFPSYGKTSKILQRPEESSLNAEKIKRKKSDTTFSFEKLKNLSTDDYILLFLIFMLLKDNESPDWPLIASLGYILFDFND